MRNWKRQISLVLVLCMLLGLFPLGAVAATVTHTGTVGVLPTPAQAFSNTNDRGFSFQWVVGGRWAPTPSDSVIIKPGDMFWASSTNCYDISIAPRGTATRAQTAAMLMRFIEGLAEREVSE